MLDYRIKDEFDDPIRIEISSGETKLIFEYDDLDEGFDLCDYIEDDSDYSRLSVDITIVSDNLDEDKLFDIIRNGYLHEIKLTLFYEDFRKKITFSGPSICIEKDTYTTKLSIWGYFDYVYISDILNNMCYKL